MGHEAGPGLVLETIARHVEVHTCRADRRAGSGERWRSDRIAPAHLCRASISFSNSPTAASNWLSWP
jgi:hypothetical protein